MTADLRILSKIVKCYYALILYLNSLALGTIRSTVDIDAGRQAVIHEILFLILFFYSVIICLHLINAFLFKIALNF